VCCGDGDCGVAAVLLLCAVMLVVLVVQVMLHEKEQQHDSHVKMLAQRFDIEQKLRLIDEQADEDLETFRNLTGQWKGSAVRCVFAARVERADDVPVCGLNARACRCAQRN
jgi:hypothetical protein